MANQELLNRIERAIQERVGIQVEAAEVGNAIVLRGMAESGEASKDATLIAGQMAPPTMEIQNELDVLTPVVVMSVENLDPEGELEELYAGSEGPVATAPDPSDTDLETAFPPTDPVITTDERGDAEVLGGFSETSMSSINVAPSAEDNLLGDEAIADAIRRELREDAATADLRVQVRVDQGVVHLHGTVPTLEDAESAEEVAARVPGVVEVIEQLEVVGL
jgi:hypothetical protein